MVRTFPVRWLWFVTAFVLLAHYPVGLAQVTGFAPVTDRTMENPSADDWIMFSRTHDAQRYSPLDQVNRQNVADLRLAWSRGMRPGLHEHIPLAYRGVLYVANPPAILQALDATTGDLIWEYQRRLPRDLADYISSPGRAKAIGIYDDLVFFAAADGYVVALDASSGDLRWETKAHDYQKRTGHVSGLIVADGKVFTGRNCSASRDECFIASHDARTGRELWKFYTTAGPDGPHGDSWGNVAVQERVASPWGLPGSFDPERNLLYWGIANPKPYTRLKRHGGNIDDIPRSAPADLYSNSTVALNPETGQLVWYYQHLPGDDWDADHTQERILLRTRLDPDPGSVKWINPQISRGQERDILVTVGEPGGIWVLDRADGSFLWATPFPYDVPDFHISHIDVETGKTYLNWDKVFKKDGDEILTCFHNTKGYWPMAYHPGYNSLYIPYHDSCLSMTANMKDPRGWGPRVGIPRPGSDPDKFAGIAKVNMETGRLDRIYTSPVPTNGAILATAGDLIFSGDLNRRLRAFDADSGRVLWEAILGGVIQMSTITYAVDGKQYVAVLTGDGASGTRGPLRQVPSLKPPRGHNEIYVFALP